LRTLVEYSSSTQQAPEGIFAPYQDDEKLSRVIDELREQGSRVIVALPGQVDDAKAMGCDRKLEKQNDKWVVVKA
jgi:ATP phosphoribosyltransferase regulatory subunit